MGLYWEYVADKAWRTKSAHAKGGMFGSAHGRLRLVDWSRVGILCDQSCYRLPLPN